MPLTIYQRRTGRTWNYRGTIEGKRFRGTTGLQSRADAQRFIIKLQAELLSQEKTRKERGDRLTFAAAALIYRKAGKPTRFIDLVENKWKDTPVDKITAGELRKAAIEMYPRATGSTRNRHVIVPTQAIINYAADLSLCHSLRVKRFKVETKVKKPATWEWVKGFMANANPHLGAICCFMFLTGARVSEATSLKWADINMLTSKALIRQTKVGRERLAHLPPEMIEALKKIEGDRDPQATVFKYSSRHTLKPQWNKVFKRCDIEYLTFHCCRHGFATSLLHRGVDPITVAKLGGWVDAQLVFRTYGHAMQDDTLSNLLTDPLPDTNNVHTLGKRSINRSMKIIE